MADRSTIWSEYSLLDGETTLGRPEGLLGRQIPAGLQGTPVGPLAERTKPLRAQVPPRARVAVIDQLYSGRVSLITVSVGQLLGDGAGYRFTPVKGFMI